MDGAFSSVSSGDRLLTDPLRPAGRLIYFGPMGEAVEYFKEMGYEPQPRQTSADFLVAVTDPKGRFPREGCEDKVPKTADEFVRYWKDSQLYKDMAKTVDEQLQSQESQDGQGRIQAFRDSARKDRVKRQSEKSPYLISYPCVVRCGSALCALRRLTAGLFSRMMVRLAMTRRFQMQMGDMATLAIVSIAALFQACVPRSLRNDASRAVLPPSRSSP